MQTLKHRPKHQQLFFMPLCHFGRCHAGVGGIGKHQEQVSVERTTNALADILDVAEQVL